MVLLPPLPFSNDYEGWEMSMGVVVVVVVVVGGADKVVVVVVVISIGVGTV